MAMADVEQQRHAVERGQVLRVLHEDYCNEMTSVRTLQGTLDALGVFLSQDGLEFHLTYLEAQGYLRIWRAKDTPGWRSDRAGRVKPNQMMFAKLLPKGLQLLDGLTPEDPMVRF
jgi:hypothetical protein